LERSSKERGEGDFLKKKKKKTGKGEKQPKAKARVVKKRTWFPCSQGKIEGSLNGKIAARVKGGS